ASRSGNRTRRACCGSRTSRVSFPVAAKTEGRRRRHGARSRRQRTGRRDRDVQHPRFRWRRPRIWDRSPHPRRNPKGDCDMRTSSNYALRLPASLKKAVEEAARQDVTTLNQFIVSAVAEKLTALKTADYFAKRASRADFRAFDRLMRPRRGEAPQPGDEMPESYQKRKSPRR